MLLHRLVFRFAARRLPASIPPNSRRWKASFWVWQVLIAWVCVVEVVAVVLVVGVSVMVVVVVVNA